MQRIVIDGNWLGMRNFHAAGKIQDRSKLAISIMQSLLKIIRTDEYRSQIIVAWDGGSYRYRGYQEDYKEGREYDEAYNCLWEVLATLHEHLPKIGIHSIRCKGVEADDLGYYYGWRAVEENVFTLLTAIDRDWLISINEKTSVFRPAINKAPEELVTHQNIVEKFPIQHFSEFLIYKAIFGDGSDNIPGVTTGVNINEAVCKYKTGQLGADIVEKIDKNINLMRLNHIVTDTEVHEMIKECESKMVLNVPIRDPLTAICGTFPEYFNGVVGKYHRLRKSELIERL